MYRNPMYCCRDVPVIDRVTTATTRTSTAITPVRDAKRRLLIFSSRDRGQMMKATMTPGHKKDKGEAKEIVSE